MRSKRKRLLKKYNQLKKSSNKITDLTEKLCVELVKQGYKISQEDIAPGFHSFDVSIHTFRGTENLVIHNIVNGWEVRKTYGKSEGIISQLRSISGN